MKLGYLVSVARALFLAIFASYALLAAPSVYFLDSGELSAAAYGLGVAHPTGFPLFCLLGKSATLVPLGEIGFRVNLLSGVCAAATLTLLFQVGRLWLGTSLAATAGAVLGALLPAVSLTFFRQATVAEVYAPTALAWAGALYLYVRLAERPSPRLGLGLALVLGLSLGLHAELRAIAIVPGGIVLLVHLLRGRRFAACAPAILLLGAGITLYLPVRAVASRPPAINWGRPATAAALSDTLAAGRIRRAFKSEMLTTDRGRLSSNAVRFGAQTIDELGALALVVAAAGVPLLGRKRPGAAALLVLTALADGAYAVWVNPMGNIDLQNGIPLDLALGLLAGAGAAELGARLGRAGGAAAIAVAACVLSPALLHELAIKQGGGGGADRLAQSILAEAGPRGAVLGSSDSVNAGLLFARAIGERPDLIALPQQHLWDRGLVEQVFHRAEAGAPPASGKEVIAALAARGEVLWEDGPDAPPAPFSLRPAAPLLKLGGSQMREQSPAELLHVMKRTCAEVAVEPEGRRVCSSLLVGVGTTLLRVGSLARARPLLEVALELRPGNVAALVNLGVLLWESGDAAGAAQLEERALEIDPKSFTAALNAGRYRLHTGDAARARRLFEHARALRPDSGAALAGLGLALVRLGQGEAGRRLIEEAVRKDPNGADTRAAVAEIAR